jgi:hypothetical protein
MRRITTRLLLWGLMGGLLVLAVLPAVAASSRANELLPYADRPWTLREFYSFNVEECILDYDERYANMRLRLKGTPGAPVLPQNVIAESTGFSVTLSDGRVLTPPLLGEGFSQRESYDGPLGKGHLCSVEFPPHQGLIVRSAVLSLQRQPYMLLKVSVKNTGETPVGIQSIRPMVFEPGGISGWGPESKMRIRPLAIRGGVPVVDGSRPPLMTLFQDPARQVNLVFGVVPYGRASSGTDFQASDNAWFGEIRSDFDPAVILEGGETLESDPAWIAYGLMDTDHLDHYYSLSLVDLPRQPQGWDCPRAWVTVEEEAGLTELVRRAQQGKEFGVNMALIPAAWEGRPGSMRGAAPRYPGNMADAARALQQAGSVPGLTLDPLLTQGGSERWAAQSSDGQTWLDLSSEEAKEAARKRVRSALSWGFKFLVVPPSNIPDEVLSHFRMTRQQADMMALVVTAEAAGATPVLPSSAMSLTAVRDLWLKAAGTASRMAEHRVFPAPLRLDLTGLTELDQETSTAIRLWPGPVEVVGAPGARARDGLAQCFRLPRLMGRQIESVGQEARLWQMKFHGPAQAYYGAAVLAFGGTQPWAMGDLELDSDHPMILWRASDGALLDLAEGRVPGSSQLEVFGVTPRLDRPLFLGVSMLPSLGLDRIRNLNWNEDQGVLSGTITGPVDRGARAHFYIPDAWEFRSGSMGPNSVREKPEGKRLSCAISGDSVSFELRFRRR